MQNLTDEQSKDKILKNCFTAYLATTVQHRRADYVDQKERNERIQDKLEQKYTPQIFDLEKEALKGLPITMRMENETLLAAFLSLEEREQYILLKRIIDEVSLDMLARELGLSYKGASAAYYRAVKKLKRKMIGE